LPELHHPELSGEHSIDVHSNFIVPGFIDIHTHSDLAILINRPAESAVRQGVTTQIVGNCGMSPAPVDQEHFAEVHSWWEPEADMPGVSWEWQDFGSYLDAIEDGGIAINIGALVGHGALRLAAMGLATGASGSS
jgi:N-acyl-D-aspartate/D-glutamate deacylase